MASYRV
jgi:hypothetical protein